MTLDVVPLGRTGTKVAEIALGTWRFGRETDAGEVEVGRGRAFELLDAYADHGGNFIDTADGYGGGTAEELIGDWLQGRDRERFVIATKIYWPTDPDDPNARGLNRNHLRRQLEVSLDRLRTDYVDLLYIHRWDDDTPVDEFMRTLSGFVDDGRVTYLGASTKAPNAWQVVRANELARREGYVPFVVTQPRYNLVHREIEENYLEMCRTYGLGVASWSPLAGGVLTGKYERDETPPAGTRAGDYARFAERYLEAAAFDVVDEVVAVAAAVGATPAQVALAWLLHHPDVTAPIVGARTVDQLEEDLGATAVDLGDDEVERLTAARPGRG